MTGTIERIKNYAVCYHQITKKRRLTKSYVLWAVLPGLLLLRAPEFAFNITQRLPVYALLLVIVFSIAGIGNFIIAALGTALLCLLAVLLNT